MGLFGDLVINAMGGRNTIPDAPPPAQVNAQQSQQQATSGNLAALPGLEDVGTQLNQYTQSQRTAAVNAGIPGYSSIAASGGSALDSMLQGQLPPDVASAVSRASNARSFAGGYGGSEAANNLTARDLGLTSLDLTRAGLAAAPSWLGSLNAIGVAPQFNPASQFITPQQQIQVNQYNAEQQYQRQWLENQLKSLPDPGTAAIAKDVGGIADVVGTAILTAAGGVGGAAIGGAAGGMLGSSLGGQIGGAGGGGSSGFDLASILKSFGGGGGGNSLNPTGTSYGNAALDFGPAAGSDFFDTSGPTTTVDPLGSFGSLGAGFGM